MIPAKTILRLQRHALFDDSIGLHMAHRFDDGRIALAEPLQMKVYEVNQGVPYETPPLFTLQPTEAQRLMDELWHLGIRPSEGHGSTGQLAATEKHLDHLTRLLDDTLKTNLNFIHASLLRDTGCQPVPAPPPAI